MKNNFYILTILLAFLFAPYWAKTQNNASKVPPTAPVRAIAEFEPMESVFIAYPFGIPMSLIAEMSQDIMVTTIVESSYEENSVRNSYTQNGVNLANCQFMYAPTDSYWTRDYAPWWIINGDNQVSIIDFPYNRPRPNDDNIPVVASNYLNVPLYYMNIEHTGGNYMTDGMGIAASTDLIWEENPSLSETQFNELVNNYLGVHTYYTLNDPLAEYIKHIDCWGKFLDVDKVLIGQVPTSDYRYQDFEDAAEFFANTQSSYGTPYQVYRVMTPGDYPNTPYTNSLILNNKVFVPLTGSSYDNQAIAAYQQAMPGYEIHGVMANLWENTDALHCRTNGIADRGMLHIGHIPIFNDIPTKQGYEVTARIIAYSGSELYSDSLLVYYSVNQAEYQTLKMQNNGDSTFTAYIPFQNIGSEVNYYIHAADNSGRSRNHPYIGQPDPHSFVVQTAENNLYVNNNLFETEIEINSTASDILSIYNSGASEIEYNLSIENAEQNTWLTLSSNHGYVTFNSPQQITLNYNSTGLNTGEYETKINLTSQQFEPIEVTVKMTIISNNINDFFNRNALVSIAPNPLQNKVKISFETKANATTVLNIYDTNGKLIRNLVNENLKVGFYNLNWNCETLKSGVYFFNFTNGNFTQRGKIVKL